LHPLDRHPGQVSEASTSAASRRLFQVEGFIQSTPENEAHVLITHLDKPAGTIAEVMKALVRQNGGRVDDVYKRNGRQRW